MIYRTYQVVSHPDISHPNPCVAFRKRCILPRQSSLSKHLQFLLYPIYHFSSSLHFAAPPSHTDMFIFSAGPNRIPYSAWRGLKLHTTELGLNHEFNFLQDILQALHRASRLSKPLFKQEGR